MAWLGRTEWSIEAPDAIPGKKKGGISKDLSSNPLGFRRSLTCTVDTLSSSLFLRHRHHCQAPSSVSWFQSPEFPSLREAVRRRRHPQSHYPLLQYPSRFRMVASCFQPRKYRRPPHCEPVYPSCLVEVWAGPSGSVSHCDVVVIASVFYDRVRGDDYLGPIRTCSCEG